MLPKVVIVVVALATGVVLELGIFLATGRSEAWDSDVFWTTGLPIVILIALALGFLARSKDWVWAGLIAPGQVATMMARNGELVSNLWPLTLILSAFLCTPFVGAAFVGSRLRPAKYRAQAAAPPPPPVS
jgi:hypothetical protein